MLEAYLAVGSIVWLIISFAVAIEYENINMKSLNFLGQGLIYFLLMPIFIFIGAVFVMAGIVGVIGYILQFIFKKRRDIILNPIEFMEDIF